jgi:glycosyltransferase involved in cell wall biosynthesis
MKTGELVSVVVPAFNASATIDETLRSIRSQTHSRLEIIVIDDGSSDDTRAIALRHAEVDKRIKVIVQENAGVAKARNVGWQQAESDLIAFIDADDLWAPAKIERQIATLTNGGERVGLVYCWFVKIDERGQITEKGENAAYEGEVLDRILLGNFIGNGSSALVRRQVLIDARGFESGLRASGAEGCEDIIFYSRVAGLHHFAVVPDYLVGYRQLENNMSSDLVRMLRSWMLLTKEMKDRHPDLASTATTGLHNYSVWLIRKAMITQQLGHLFRLMLLLLRTHPKIAGKIIAKTIPSMIFQTARKLLFRLPRPCVMAGATTPIIGTRFRIGEPAPWP